MALGKILVIAGSDSSGGAGLEADQKVIAAHQCYAMTATTALTAQNTLGVHDIHYIPSYFVAKQIRCNLEDTQPDVVKIGMLASIDTITAVCKVLKEKPVGCIVLDPVMMATSGAQLLPENAVKSLVTNLLPITTVITPNIPEAKLLLEQMETMPKDILTVNDMVDISRRLLSLGPKHVFLKGGHMPLTENGTVARTECDNIKVVNILASKLGHIVIETPFFHSRNTHGTGCSLASAMASNIAKGETLENAARAATRYVEAAIRTSEGLGKGNGPINHFHSTYTLPFVPDRFLDYVLDRDDIRDVWNAFTKHEFVKKLANGTLQREKFQYYLVQDYLYLIQLARAYALAAYKVKDIDSIIKFSNTTNSIQEEMRKHLELCADFGLSKAEIEATQEDIVCTAYTRYILDVGQTEDCLSLQVAISPCFIGYARIAEQLYNDPDTVKDGNQYHKWILGYSNEDFKAVVTDISGTIERYIVNESPASVEKLVDIFRRATLLETAFWDMGMAHR
ncbi:MAG: hypothetical protein M1814_002014 [Vezdaea aestivalis]|nr:MAG: hypothetical protein M1814_002014 [Vezdaea aestivalis]